VNVGAAFCFSVGDHDRGIHIQHDRLAEVGAGDPAGRDIITKTGRTVSGSVFTFEPGSAGVTPVAILSTAEFDASTEVDPSTVACGRSGTETFIARWSATDVNRDRRPDLLLLAQPAQEPHSTRDQSNSDGPLALHRAYLA
jgi:hypothetical protein